MTKYNTNETLAFVHGYAYAKAEFIKQNDEAYKDTPINDIIGEIIHNTVKEFERKGEVVPLEKTQVMPIIDGESFHCQCGCNVFTKTLDGIYQCNACPSEYSGK